MVRPNGIITKIGWGRSRSISTWISWCKSRDPCKDLQPPVLDLERALGLLSSGQIDLELIIGGVYPLGDWVEGL